MLPEYKLNDRITLAFYVYILRCPWLWFCQVKLWKSPGKAASRFAGKLNWHKGTPKLKVLANPQFVLPSQSNRRLSGFMAENLYSHCLQLGRSQKPCRICSPVVRFGGIGGYSVGNCLCHLNLLCPFYVSLWFYGQTFIYVFPLLESPVTPIAFD